MTRRGATNAPRYAVGGRLAGDHAGAPRSVQRGAPRPRYLNADHDGVGYLPQLARAIGVSLSLSVD